jgi:hypothetical protein
LRRIGGITLGVGLGVLVVWGLYHYFRWALLASLPWPVKLAIAAVGIGLIVLLVSLGCERHRAAKDEKERFKEVEK